MKDASGVLVDRNASPGSPSSCYGQSKESLRRAAPVATATAAFDSAPFTFVQTPYCTDRSGELLSPVRAGWDHVSASDEMGIHLHGSGQV